LRDGGHGRRGEPLGLLGVGRHAHDASQGLQAPSPGFAFAGQDEGGGAVGDGGGGGGGNGAVLGKGGPERRDAFHVAAARLLVGGDGDVTLPVLDRHRCDLGSEVAVALGGQGPLHRLDGEL